MEDSWAFIDDDDNSSVYSLADSDKIDSETEAELYSKIHYGDNLSLNDKPSELIVYSPFKNDTFCINNGKNASTPIKFTNEDLPFNQTSCDNFSTLKRKSSEMETNCKNSNSQKKYKSAHVSDLPSGILDSNDSKIMVSNSFLKSKPNLKDDTLLLDSSDSDSIFLMEPNTENSDLRINLLKDTETVFLSSSDSDNEEEVKSPLLKRDSILKNLSMPNMKIEKNSKGLWHINYEDLRRSKKHSYRYHENFSVTCSNCNRKGHISRTCPSPRVVKCFVCGGNHLASRCAKRMCSRCYTPGHDRKNCFRRIIRRICYLCNVEGHTRGNCPDLWRRYHLTTKPSAVKIGKPFKQDTKLYCCNCGKSGHFVGICPLLHNSGSSFNTWPCVVSYDDPKYLLKDRLSLLKNAPPLNIARQDKHLNSISGSSAEKNINYKFKNEMNASSGSNEENKGNKRKKKKLGTALRFNKVQDIIQGKDFPRTPKKKSPTKRSKIFNKLQNESESPKSIMRKQLNNLKKQWKMQGKDASFQLRESQELVTQSGASKIKIEDSLPDSISLQVMKRFNRWKNNRKKRFRQQQNNAKRRELTKS